MLHEDENLVVDLRKGDQQAFEAIYRKYWKKLYTFARNRLRFEDAAEEIVQDVFTSLWLKRETLVIRKSLQSYLYSAVRYCVYAYLDAQAVREGYSQEASSRLSEGHNSVEDTLSFEELSERLEKEVSALPEKCQQVFRLRKQEELSIKEIAQQLNVSPKAVEGHLTRALKALRIGLQDFLSLVWLIYFFS